MKKTNKNNNRRVTGVDIKIWGNKKLRNSWDGYKT